MLPPISTAVQASSTGTWKPTYSDAQYERLEESIIIGETFQNFSVVRKIYEYSQCIFGNRLCVLRVNIRRFVPTLGFYRVILDKQLQVLDRR